MPDNGHLSDITDTYQTNIGHGESEESEGTERRSLPSSWQVVKLGSIVRKKITDGTHKTPIYTKTGIPFISANNIKKSHIDFSSCKYISKEEHETLIKRCKPEKEDILLSKVGTLGLTTKVNENIEFSIFVQLALIKPNLDLVNPDFLKYVLESNKMQDQINLMASQSTMKYIGVQKISELKIPLPNISEQKKIASVLLALQKAKEEIESVIEATNSLKKSLMNHLFIYGPVSVENVKNLSLKETEIGLIRAEWDIKMLTEIVLKTPGVNPKNFPEKIFKYIDVSSISRDSLKINSYSEYKGSEAPSRAKRLLKTNDVLFATIRPKLKRVALVNSDFNEQICSTAFCILRVDKKKVDPYYLFSVVSNDSFVDRVSSHQRGSSYPAVSNKDVLNQVIPIPPLDIQREIGNVILKIDKKIEAEKNKKKALEELYKTILNGLMTAKIRVNDLDI
ncbi:MAG: restriction endonuclease subunit S [Methanobacterium sp.]